MSAKPITKSATKLEAAERIRATDRNAIAMMRERPDMSFSEAWKVAKNAKEGK